MSLGRWGQSPHPSSHVGKSWLSRASPLTAGSRVPWPVHPHIGLRSSGNSRHTKEGPRLTLCWSEGYTAPEGLLGLWCVGVVSQTPSTTGDGVALSEACGWWGPAPTWIPQALVCGPGFESHVIVGSHRWSWPDLLMSLRVPAFEAIPSPEGCDPLSAQPPSRCPGFPLVSGPLTRFSPHSDVILMLMKKTGWAGLGWGPAWDTVSSVPGLTSLCGSRGLGQTP